MKVAVVHYHLRPGGVTRVIDQAAASLRRHGVEMAVLTGRPYEGDALRTQVVDGLDYNRELSSIDPLGLAANLKMAAIELLHGEPDIWHFHNHSLGKNLAMPEVVALLAQECPTLLQLHDFAEDGRPANYAAMAQRAESLQHLYPLGEHIHYGLLNARDCGLLRAAGVPGERLHCLPNAVATNERPEPPTQFEDIKDKRLFLYPTRAIRRKNLGEFLLWAIFAERGDCFATTLTPDNPEAQPTHDAWVAFAKELELPVLFGLGEREEATFGGLMKRAQAIVTTSIAEGFGMAYLEPWPMGRILLGRNLPEITDDFSAHGLDLEHLYPWLLVPLEWVGEDALAAALGEAMARSYEAYGLPMPQDAVERALGAIIRGGRVDFGRLDEPLQMNVLRRLKAEPRQHGQLKPMNLEQPLTHDTLAVNEQVVREQYGGGVYGERLNALYDKLVAASVSEIHYIEPGAVMREFLSPERFNLLRT